MAHMNVVDRDRFFEIVHAVTVTGDQVTAHEIATRARDQIEEESRPSAARRKAR